MPNCRRNLFFTENLLDRKSQWLVTHNDELRAAVRKTRQLYPFHIDVWVVLPEHMHCIWTLPKGDTDYSNRWRLIKKTFSKSIPKTEYRSANRIKRHERGIWQRRFGNIPSTMTQTMLLIWITSITIQSSMDG